MFHNHVKKDYSYGWITPDIIAKTPAAAWFHSENSVAKAVKAVFPFFAWFSYLLGINDGSHFIPLKNQRLWKETPAVEFRKCLISTASVAFFATLNYFVWGQNLAAMAFYYLAPLVMFGWWLVTVTYLQHHHDDSIVYDNQDWKFLDSAFETVDRKYGLGIDHLSHHITDGHVAHHLFYTLIPHYNLPIATKAIRSFLKQNDAEHVYRLEDTKDFPARVHRNVMKFGLKARRANPNLSQSTPTPTPTPDSL